ncbi:phenylalanine--tRNA ligase alpha subunit-like [Diaphorina citri]|uniref:Phenylalanine--tRNA ligase alpha subunit-like n=1 Tax=Diaphorina citri TaxID=121845 RepID=A0A1S3D397_DIACI|nr:phenylalanine--tRNA ligase alpha subunit-like [Diaphorina citri]
MASDLTEKILKYLDTNPPVDTLDLAKLFNEDHQKVVGGMKSIETLGEYLIVEPLSHKIWELTGEGNQVKDNGSHEVLVFNNVPSEGIGQKELLATFPNAKVGFSKAMAKGWISLDKATGKVLRKVDSVTDELQAHLKLIANNEYDKVPEANKVDYKKRKLLQEVTIKSFLLKKGPEFSTTIQKPETELTPEMIASGSWKTLNFKPYNFDAMGISLPSGHLHPLMKVRAEFRQIFLDMGFTEMPTNNFVESSFWNFDALFQPQQHPARDAHDTFFVTDPKTTAMKRPTSKTYRNKDSTGGFELATFR